MLPVIRSSSVNSPVEISKTGFKYSLLRTLPTVHRAEHEEAMQFIENYRLMGKGLGYIDMHLLASAMLNNIPLWTLDKKLNEASSKLGIKHTP